MASTQRRLILGNGEQYVQPLAKIFKGRTPEPPRSYADARDTIRQGIESALDLFSRIPAKRRLPDEVVACLRLHPDATAKSYDPAALFDDSPQLRKVGSRNYKQNLDSLTPTKRIQKLQEAKETATEGRMVFVQSSPQGFRQFLSQLDRPESRVPKLVQAELRRVERFDLLEPGERIVGFETTWKKGRVELVFHPSRLSTQKQLEFVYGLFDDTGVEPEGRQVRAYPEGPTFVSCRLNSHALAALRDVNPLRSAHPLVFGGLADLRNAPTAQAPKPPAAASRSTIKIGMFDGGVDLSVPHLQGHVEEDVALSIGTPSNATAVAHGTAVAGALLYGALNPHAASARLPSPPVSVVSFRALPTSSATDIDLYESIDVIERVVPARKDIKVYNVSFGPKGPILDDTISRFTFTLDALAVAHKVAFVVAAGNDGDVSGLDRIQAPSDAVHGLGVGAFTRSNGGRQIADYSCKGPGRECGKIKPDVAGFGGCPLSPIHLISQRHGERVLSWGTSFASPLVARVGAQAADAFDRSTPLLARALIIHGATHPDGAPDHLMGHGCAPEDVEEVLGCDANAVTVVFQSDIVPTKTVRLPIPWADAMSSAGKVRVRWTVAGLSPVDPNHPSDYTSGCLEDTFYPHGRRFAYFKPKTNLRKVLDAESDKTEIAKLLGQGWKQPALPQTESGNNYRTESDRRAIDCQWEPLVRREVSKNASSMFQPFLTLHAIGRNSVPARFDYAVVITVSVPKYQGDLYTDIRTKYPALAPIRIRTEAELRVQI